MTGADQVFATGVEVSAYQTLIPSVNSPDRKESKVNCGNSVKGRFSVSDSEGRANQQSPTRKPAHKMATG